MVPFGGWDMPLNYPTGTIAEHMACRNDAVVFDVSHMGALRVVGARAFDLLQALFTNDMGRIAPGRAQYTHLLEPTDASVIDDVIISWIAPDVFEVVPNASNTEAVLEVLVDEAEAHRDVEVHDVTSRRAMVALQGPTARRRFAGIAHSAAAVGRFAVERFEWEAMPCVVTGTGYTGEDGVECSIPVEVAASFWHAVVDAGFTPAGLGARDTLRLEAGLPLHGHELGTGITSLQAGLGWVVAWEKGEFRGRAPLAAEKQTGPARILRGIALEGRRPPRADLDVFVGDDRIGRTTSGNFSPVLDHGIAMALVTPSTSIGDGVEIDIRGTRVPGRVVEMPFVRRS